MDILLHNVGVPLWAVCLVGLILAVLAVLLAKRKESRWEKIYLRTFDALEDRGISPSGGGI